MSLSGVAIRWLSRCKDGDEAIAVQIHVEFKGRDGREGNDLRDDGSMHVVAPEEVPDGASEMDPVAERVASLGAPLRQLIDERLAAIAESIRSVEWRNYVARGDGPVRPAPPPLEPPRRTPPIGAPPSRFPLESPRALAGAPATTSAPPADAPVDDDFVPTIPDGTATGEPEVAPSADDPTDGTAAVPLAVPEGAAIAAETTPGEARPLGRRVSPWLVAVMVVVVGVVVVRLTTTTIPGSLTPTVVTHTTAHAVAPAPVSSVTRAKYLAASTQMDMANATATRSLSGAAGDSVAQVDQAVGPYVRALQTFVYTVHFLSWPGVTAVSSEELTQRVQTLVTYSATDFFVDPATVQAWIVKFRSLATDVQAADNLVRRQIGIATTASYP